MIRHRLWTGFRKVDIFLDKHAVPLAIMLIVIIIRLPTIAEPYWYGDEAIYLTVGNSLRAGERMYVDIIDHKTPLIYYIAELGNTQFGYRMLGTASLAITSVAFYFLMKDFFPRPKQRFAVMAIFIAYTNLPRYEGNVPNGETFVMMFVMLALLAFRRTKIWQSFLHPNEKFPSRPVTAKMTHHTFLLLSAGALMGLATLTKVPAVFDFAVIFAVGFFVYIEALARAKAKEVTVAETFSSSSGVLGSLAFQLGLVFTGWIAMLSLSVLYYFLRGSLTEYIDYGLLYNFRYADSWKPEYSSSIVAFFFTLKGKVILLAAWMFGLAIFRRNVSKAFLFGGAWMGLALVAATLSNRPYPHYFLQVFPALAIVVTAGLTLIWTALRRLFIKKRGHTTYSEMNATRPIFEAAGTFIIISALVAIISVLHVVPYPTVKYYSLFFQLVSKQITWEQYRDQFNPVLNDTYQVARILRRSPEDETFVWGSNPILYALSGKNPVGRFTVAFHIDDFNAYDETLKAVELKNPAYIIVMKNQAPLPGLREYLMSSYIPNSDYPTMTVWRRSVR